MGQRPDRHHDHLKDPGHDPLARVPWLLCLLWTFVAAAGCVADRQPPPPGCDIQVEAPASIHRASESMPTGATLCLSGHFLIPTPIRPKDGQTFLGPAVLEGVDGAETGFEMKGGAGNQGIARDVTIERVEMFGFFLRAVECWQGTNVRGSELHHNGRNGLGCGLRAGGVLIERNDIHHNGDPSHTGSGAGGMKLAGGDGVLIRGNRIHENIGNGIWCDVDCGTFTAVGNDVFGNTRKGIFYEISHGPALIAGNTVTFNNCAPRYWPDPEPACDLPDGSFGPQSASAPGGGIATNSSLGVTIRDNVFEGNEGSAIAIRDDARPYDAPLQTVIEDNELGGDEIRGCEIEGVSCS